MSLPSHKIRKILITAGPTREMLDPVRFLSNLSTGEMGYRLAKIAKKMGYEVTLISGPTSIQPPQEVKFISIVSAQDLKKACEKEFPKHDVLIMTAAVCDFTAAKMNSQKIQRTKTHQVFLRQTPDIVAGIGKQKGDKMVIGFCLETSDWIQKAKAKLMRKSLDGIVANYYNHSHNPFGNRKINTAFVATSEILRLQRATKDQVASRLVRWIEELAVRKGSSKKAFSRRAK